MCPDSNDQAVPTEGVSARFSEGEKQTVIDRKRGLLWLKYDTWQLAGKWMNWVQCREFSEELNQQKFAGFTD